MLKHVKHFCPLDPYVKEKTIVARILNRLLPALLVILASQNALADTYDVAIVAEPLPQSGKLKVTVKLSQSDGLLREMRMRMPADYFSDFEADGELSYEDEELTWEPPEDGGSLSWLTEVNRRKNDRSYDSFMNMEWAMFRGSDMMPPAATRAVSGATGKTTLEFVLPSGWSSATEYPGEHHRYIVDNPERRFDRPTGWILLGQIGTRTDDVSGTHVKVTGPKNQGLRRLDTLAFLRFTLPEMMRIFPDMPKRLSVFMAGTPMWRGGLSAPASVYVHASRPLISENGTSTLLHELGHTSLGVFAKSGSDWIIEGIAEFYSRQVLRRSGAISRERFDTAISKLEEWGREADTLCARSSSGPTTAKAVVVLHQLDRELRRESGGKHSLDDVVARISELNGKVGYADLAGITSELIGGESSVLADADADECEN